MPPMPQGIGGAPGMTGPSTFDKAKMGAMMGSTVGLIIGFIFGATNIFRYGAGPQGPLRTLGQYMLGSGATFGFFMSIGSVIRTDSGQMSREIVGAWEEAARRRPVVLGRRRFPVREGEGQRERLEERR